MAHLAHATVVRLERVVVAGNERVRQKDAGQISLIVEDPKEAEAQLVGAYIREKEAGNDDGARLAYFRDALDALKEGMFKVVGLVSNPLNLSR